MESSCRAHRRVGGWGDGGAGGRAIDLWERFYEVVGEDEGLDQLAYSQRCDRGTIKLVVAGVKVSEREDTANGGKIIDALIADV